MASQIQISWIFNMHAYPTNSLIAIPLVYSRLLHTSMNVATLNVAIIWYLLLQKKNTAQNC